MKDEKIVEVIKMLELTRKLINMDMYMAIFDNTGEVKYLYPETGGVDGIKVGEVFKDPTGKLNQALATGKTIHNCIQSEKVGIELEGNLVPIKVGDHVIGCVSMTYIPINQQSLEAQQVALQSIYSLILSVNAINDKCVEFYKSYDVNKLDLSFLTFTKFKEQTMDLVHPDDKERYSELTELTTLKDKLSSRNSISCECRIKLQDNKLRWSEVIMGKVGLSNDIKNEEKYLYMVRDIHERKTQEDEVNKENRHLIEQLKKANEALIKNGMSDEMTHMYNRKGLEYFSAEIFNEAKKKGNILFGYIADLNGLKYINDHFGHGCGDNAIRVFGKILWDSASEEAVCARIGGDEFVMLASYSYKSEVPYKVVREVQEKIKVYNQNSNLPYNVEVSFGYFLVEPEKGKTLENYMKIADKRMYGMKMKSKEVKSMMSETLDMDLRTIDCGKEKILIADDDLFMRKILKCVFDKKSIIIEVEDGNEAVNIVKSEDNLALILLDINMPKLDGFGVLEELQKSGVLRKIPVIMMTASDNPSMEEKGYNSGVSEFIHKPFNLTVVKHRLENILQLHKKQNQLTVLLKEKDNILENQAKKLADQAEQLKDK